ncbi:hypothetical protein EDC04DRAFT_535428 [Pisolithus marmoratus]|nr:hypothetical protein EDC04DRAFT_535428 [Pisolithus marmoratus]
MEYGSPSRPQLMPRAPPPLKLQPVDLETWDDGAIYGDSFYAEVEPEELDEPWPYRFKSGDLAWVKSTSGRWYHGKVVGQAKLGRTIQGEGLFWLVVFSSKFRKYFAPLNGEIKPDTRHTRKLLEDAGWSWSESE